MGDTYACLHYHFVFSTKNRESWINPDLEGRVWEFLGGIARQNGLKPIIVGGMPDHIHMAVGSPPTVTLSKVVQQIKGGSSRWIKDLAPGIERVRLAGRLRGLCREQIESSGAHGVH